MMKTKLQWTVPFAAGFLLLLSCGCELLKNEKRILKRQVRLYQVMMSQGKFQKAARTYHAKSFVWVRSGEKKDLRYKGGNPSAAFMKSIEKIPERSDVIIHVNKIDKLGEGKYLVKARFQIRGHSASSVMNTRWDCSMTWILNGGKWRVVEHKELTGRKFTKS